MWYTQDVMKPLTRNLTTPNPRKPELAPRTAPALVNALDKHATAVSNRKLAGLVPVLVAPALIGAAACISVLLKRTDLPPEAVVGFGLMAVIMALTVVAAIVIPKTFNDETGHSCLFQPSSMSWDVYRAKQKPQLGQQPNVPYGRRVDQ